MGTNQRSDAALTSHSYAPTAPPLLFIDLLIFDRFDAQNSISISRGTLLHKASSWPIYCPAHCSPSPIASTVVVDAVNPLQIRIRLCLFPTSSCSTHYACSPHSGAWPPQPPSHHETITIGHHPYGIITVPWADVSLQRKKRTMTLLRLVTSRQRLRR